MAIAEPEVYKFSYKELAELMARSLGLTEGLWGIQVRFGIQAANAGPGPEELVPTAIVPILEVGLRRVQEESNLTVNASALKRRTRKSPGKTRTRTKKA